MLLKNRSIKIGSDDEGEIYFHIDDGKMSPNTRGGNRCMRCYQFANLTMDVPESVCLTQIPVIISQTHHKLLRYTAAT